MQKQKHLCQALRLFLLLNKAFLGELMKNFKLCFFLAKKVKYEVYIHRSGKTKCVICLDMAALLQVQFNLPGPRASKNINIKPGAAPTVTARALLSAALASFESRKDTLPLHGK